MKTATFWLILLAALPCAASDPRTVSLVSDSPAVLVSSVIWGSCVIQVDAGGEPTPVGRVKLPG